MAECGFSHSRTRLSITVDSGGPECQRVVSVLAVERWYYFGTVITREMEAERCRIELVGMSTIAVLAAKWS